MDSKVNISSAATTLTDVISTLEKRRTGLQREIQHVDADLKATRRAITVLNQLRESGSGAPLETKDAGTARQEGDLVRDTMPGESDESITCGAATADDIAGLKFNHLAFRRIAEMNSGLLHLRQAAVLVSHAREVKGTLTSVMSAQRQRMTASPDWERVTPGVYRLIKSVPAQ